MNNVQTARQNGHLKKRKNRNAGPADIRTMMMMKQQTRTRKKKDPL